MLNVSLEYSFKKKLRGYEKCFNIKKQFSTFCLYLYKYENPKQKILTNGYHKKLMMT